MRKLYIRLTKHAKVRCNACNSISIRGMIADWSIIPTCIKCGYSGYTFIRWIFIRER